MARARNIKPSIFKNEILGVADPLYTLLFEGLWVLADREGRLEDRPLRIKAEVFPYRDGIKIDEMLDWLADGGFIIRYEAAGAKFIEVLNFVKHQNPHKNEVASEIPAFGATSEKIRTTTENIGSTRADSLNLIPDSPIPQKKSAAPSGFADFWAAYPKKVGKGDAERAWKKVPADLFATILQAIAAQKVGDGWMRDGGQYIPNPATWLNAKRWTDEVRPYVPAAPKVSAAWWSTPESKLAKAKEVGAGACRPGESDDQWQARIRSCIDNGGKPPIATRSRVDMPAQGERGVKPAGLDLRALVGKREVGA